MRVMCDSIRRLEGILATPAAGATGVSEASVTKLTGKKRKRKHPQPVELKVDELRPPVAVAEGKVKFMPSAGKAVRRLSVASASSKTSRGSAKSGRSRASSASAKSARGEGKTKRKSAPKKGKAEGAIVGMSPAGSDYISGSQAYASNGASVVSNYVDMIVNPWCGRLQRLPDVCISPTSMFKMFANRTYTVSGSATYGTNLMFGCHSRLSNFSPYGVVSEAAQVNPSGGATAAYPVYPYRPGNIMIPTQYFTGSAFRAYDGSTPNSVWADDYGTQQSDLCSWTSAYRTLAMAIRVRVVGLPPSQFMAPGKIYFAQVRWDTEDVPITEQDYVVLEQKGRASHVSLDAVRDAGSKTFFVTPDGPGKLDFSSTFLPAPGVYQYIPAGSDVRLGQRRFLATSDIGPAAYAVNVNGTPNTPTLANCVAPYGASQFVGDGPDQANADTTYLLVATVFGAADNTVLEVDYAICGEFLPDKNAPPGIETAVQVPNSRALDEIYASAAVVSDLKAAMLQSAGDKTQIGLTAPSVFAPHGAHGAVAEGRSVKSGIMRSVGRIAGGRYVRARAEGFFDSLGDAFSAAAGGAMRSGLGSLTDSLPPPRRRAARRPRYDDDDYY